MSTTVRPFSYNVQWIHRRTDNIRCDDEVPDFARGLRGETGRIWCLDRGNKESCWRGEGGGRNRGFSTPCRWETSQRPARTQESLDGRATRDDTNVKEPRESYVTRTLWQTGESTFSPRLFSVFYLRKWKRRAVSASSNGTTWTWCRGRAG